MLLRKFGNSDLNVTPVIFGAWEIGGAPFFSNVSEKKSVALIKACYDLGVNFIDTAPVYGFGKSETIVGKAVKGFRERVVISTKCGLRWTNETISGIYKDASRASVLEEIDLSLKRLETDYIDIYLVHWPDTDTRAPLGETIQALEEIKKQGKIRYYGLSNFSVEQMNEASLHGTISCLQSQYSMLCRDIEKKELVYCRENSIGFQAYSPLHRGVLTDKSIDKLKKTGQAAIDWILKNTNNKKFGIVEELKEISRSYDIPFATFVINWTISQPGVTTAIIGTTNVDHIKEAIKAVDLKISEEDMAEIDEIIKES